MEATISKPTRFFLFHNRYPHTFSSSFLDTRRSASSSSSSSSHSLLFTLSSSPFMASIARNHQNPSGDDTEINPNPQQLPIKTVKVVVKGRVQGVFYRNWTVENARNLGLNGWVRNRRDGSVEALFSGDPSSVDEMEQRCRRGPSDALVTNLQVFPSDEDPAQGFHRYPTL